MELKVSELNELNSKIKFLENKIASLETQVDKLIKADNAIKQMLVVLTVVFIIYALTTR